MPLFKTGRSEEKKVDVALGEVACPKMQDHLLFAKFALQNPCATSPSVGEVLSLASC